MWVFAYGSLIWDPGFPVQSRLVARAEGWHRSFCMWSIHYRGTALAPGLVLALDQAAGATCHGLALQVAPGHEDATLQMLRERELISSAYVERHLPVHLSDGRSVSALAFVINRDHDQYCALSLDEQAAIIARAHGIRGPNRDYLDATARHLADLGIADADLDWLAARVAMLPQMRPS
jgi:glutathione-specific gamma-glutamylcyclotransferase